ncbi:MAG: 2,3-bisphosphoglycerate-independent phosphoglycerate mutase [Gammaproteobacteria bacterium]
MTQAKHPVMLVVLDGWGHSDETDFNAIAAAHTPVFDRLWSERPHTLIDCSGTAVGLPAGQMGNSEVGHMHIGAGRLIDQDFSRIGKAIASGEFAANPALTGACRTAVDGGAGIHVMGLASPGGVHSHEDHLLALIDLARAAGDAPILVHAFLDGRDTPPQSAAATLDRIAAHCERTGNARLASICGRYYAMDRNQNWARTALAYELLVDGAAEYSAGDGRAALEAAYARGETDEFVRPTLITDAGGGGHRVADGDVMLFANFRADRARQITAALTQADFTGFERTRTPALGAFVSMTDYGEQFDVDVAFPQLELPNTFGAVVADAHLTQLRLAETEKYAHVTFFFNGGEERPFAGEDRVLVPSPEVATYDLEPEMSAAEVTDRLCAAIAEERYDAIICNYANADMVGHTGNFEATRRCIETLDACLGRLVEAAEAHGVDMLVTADHGNAERMRGEPGADGEAAPHTAHTSNLVPLIHVGRAARMAEHGSLVDLAPTLLSLLGLEIPPEMTGRPLLELLPQAQDAA